MSAVKSVLLAIVVASRKRDLAGMSLAHAQRAHLFAREQMVQLETYAAETESRWTAGAQVSTTPELLRHHRQFMDRLHHAIGLQRGVLKDAGHKVDIEQRLVLEAEFRLVSLRQVLKKKQADMAILQTRIEQKKMDEFAALRSRQSTGGYFSGEQS